MLPAIPLYTGAVSAYLFTDPTAGSVKTAGGATTLTRRLVAIDPGHGGGSPASVLLGTSSLDGMAFYGGKVFGRGAARISVTTATSALDAISPIAQAFSDPVTAAEGTALLASINGAIASINGNNTKANVIRTVFESWRDWADNAGMLLRS